MNLHHVRRGAGEPLLLIQGMSGNHEHWGERFLELLERDFDVIAYDHRGVGWSPGIEKSFTIAELADDAAVLLDRLGVDRAHVLGISMGGMVAQELALNHPERVRTLTLGCTYAGGPEGILADAEVFAPMVNALRDGDRDGAIRASWEANVSAAFSADAEAYALFHATALRKPTALRVLMLQMRAIAAHDTHLQLAEITAPTLIIHGSEDRMLPVVNGEAISRAMPEARFVRYDGVGHMFWIEQPDRTAELVREHALAGAAA
ncbi:MAG TPA: alpha/beta hydrolase [Solirubrobacteraceae bacterium]|nr:alpha/beta hydrolase [Solirubrobacteraceae bacterium]